LRELTVAKKAVGIDIGSHSVKAVVVSKKGSSVVINNFVEVPISPPRSAEPEQLAATVEELSKRLKIGSSLVVTSISTQKATVRNIQIPFSEEEKARQVLKFQTEPHLAFPIEEVIIDFYNTQSAPAGKMKVLLTAIHKGVIQKHLELLSRGQIDPEVVDVDFMAVSNTVVRAEPQLLKGTAMVLDIGASKTIACYIREGELLAVRCITLGGDDFTEAISKELGVSSDEAERIKTGETSDGVSAEDVSQRVSLAIASVRDRLGGELDRTVRYFSSQVGGGTLDKVILCGGSASLPGLDKFLGEALSAEVAVISPSEAIKNGSGEELPFPRFVTAIGLALRGLGQSLCLQNFRQEECAYARPFRRLRKSLALSGALVFGVCSLLVFSLFASLDRYGGRRLSLELLIQTKRATIFPDKTATDVAHMDKLLEEEKDRLTPFRELRRNISVLTIVADLSTRITKDRKVEVSRFEYTKSKLTTPTKSRRRPRTRTETTTWAGTITFRGTVPSVEDHVALRNILENSSYVGEVDDKGTTPASGGRVNFHFILKLKESHS